MSDHTSRSASPRCRARPCERRTGRSGSRRVDDDGAPPRRGVERRGGELVEVDRRRVRDHHLARPRAQHVLREPVAEPRAPVDPASPTTAPGRRPTRSRTAAATASGVAAGSRPSELPSRYSRSRVVDDEPLAEPGQRVRGVQRLGPCAVRRRGRASPICARTAAPSGVPASARSYGRSKWLRAGSTTSTTSTTRRRSAASIASCCNAYPSVSSAPRARTTGGSEPCGEASSHSGLFRRAAASSRRRASLTYDRRTGSRSYMPLSSAAPATGGGTSSSSAIATRCAPADAPETWMRAGSKPSSPASSGSRRRQRRTIATISSRVAAGASA